MLQVSAAIIRNAEGQILICRRGPGGNCAYLWEFPGGKQEPFESPEECLVRECQEELGVEIVVEGLYEHFSYAYPDQAIDFHFFNARIIKGKPEIRVHSEIRWVSPQDLIPEDFCPADITMVHHLKDHH